MAKAKAASNPVRALNSSKKNRPGVHSKKKNSNLKSSKNYRKAYRGQGR